MDFLNTIVKAHNKDDWGKLKRVMKYIKGTLGVNMTLREDSLYVIKWWLDASFDTDHDWRGHTGGTMFLVTGFITIGSWKQNINGWRSTDNTLIGVKNMMGSLLWTLYFIQGK